MRTFARPRRLAPWLLLLALGGLASCKGWVRPWSQAPELVDQSWQVQTILVETGERSLGTPSVFVDAKGQPGVVLPDRAFIRGTQSIALARRGDRGWRVEFPLAPASVRACGEDEDGATVITFGELDGPLQAVRWDGVSTESAEPGPCPRPASNMREVVAQGGTHTLERSRDGRTLWHEAPSGTACQPLDSAPEQRIEAYAIAIANGRPVVALFERPEADPEADGAAPGRLRHAVCGDAGWASSIVATGVRVTEVGLTVDGSGRSHVVYVIADGKTSRLTHAMPSDASQPAATADDRDARVEPAIEACLRLWPTPPSLVTGAEAYQQGDPLRCALLEHDPVVSQQALEALRGRCDDGQAQACAVAGSLHHWLMGQVELVLEIPADDTTRFNTEWRGLKPPGVPEDPTQALPLYGRACELGDARACLHHALLLASDDPQRLPRATTACEAGLAHGCALALAASHLHPDEALAAMAEAGLRSACEAGDAAACNDLGVLLHVRGDAAAARAAIDGACTAKVEPACRNLDRLP